MPNPEHNLIDPNFAKRLNDIHRGLIILPKNTSSSSQSSDLLAIPETVSPNESLSTIQLIPEHINDSSLDTKKYSLRLGMKKISELHVDKTYHELKWEGIIDFNIIDQIVFSDIARIIYGHAQTPPSDDLKNRTTCSYILRSNPQESKDISLSDEKNRALYNVFMEDPSQIAKLNFLVGSQDRRGFDYKFVAYNTKNITRNPWDKQSMSLILPRSRKIPGDTLSWLLMTLPEDMTNGIDLDLRESEAAVAKAFEE